MSTKKLRVIVVGMAVISAKIMSAMHVFDNPHFYRASHFFGEPRFEKKGLTSLDILASMGSTKTFRNTQGKKVDRFVVGCPSVCSGTCSCQPCISGKLHVADLIFLATQNILRGFFVQLHVPLRKVEISKPRFFDDADVSRKACTQALCFDNKGIAEVSAYVGWTKNYQNTQRIDFIDTTIKLGVITPTGTHDTTRRIFAIPIGYSGYTGASVSADGSIGAYEWLTVGGHIRGIIFSSAKKRVPLEADCLAADDVLKISCHTVQVKPGTLFEGGTYVKADHIIRGFSLLFGYSYVNKGQANFKQCDDGFTPCLDNFCYERPWNMQTVHYLFEYDFTKQKRFICPRISFYCDQQIDGKNVFDVDMTGVGFGLEIAW